MLTAEEKRKVEERKETIIRLHSEAVYGRILAGFVPEGKLAKVLTLPTDDEEE